MRSNKALQSMLRHRLDASATLPAPFLAALGSTLDRAVNLAERVASQGQETLARQAATALYDVSSAVLLAWEGSRRGGGCSACTVVPLRADPPLVTRGSAGTRGSRLGSTRDAALLDGKRLDLAEAAPMLG